MVPLRRYCLGRKIAIVVIVIASSAINGQTKATVQQKSKQSPCSNIVALTGNVNFECSSLTPKQQKLLARIPALLNRILANQNSEAVMDRLDEISQQMAKTQLSLNRLGGDGDCQANAVGGNAMVGDNCGKPPPPTIEHFEIIPPDPKTENQNHPTTTFKFRLSAVPGSQKFAVLCDRPCSADYATAWPHRGAFTIDYDSVSAANPNLAGWIINFPMHTDQEYRFSVSSADQTPVKVLQFVIADFKTPER